MLNSMQTKQWYTHSDIYITYVKAD